MRRVFARRNVPPATLPVEPKDARVGRADNQIAITICTSGRDVCVKCEHAGFYGGKGNGDSCGRPRKRAKIFFQLVPAPLLHAGILRLQMPDDAVFSRHAQMECPGKKLIPETRRNRRTQIQPVMVPGKNPPVLRAKPDRTRFILVGINDFAGRATVFKIVHHAVLNRAQPGIVRADPQIRAAVLEKENNAVARQPRRVVDVEGRDGIPIETHKTVERAKPEVAVVRLGKGEDGALRQAVRRAPDIHDER